MIENPVTMDSVAESLTENLYSSNKEDPEFLITLVDKYVKVQLIKNTSYLGFVHTIDPISKSIILTVPSGTMFQTMFLPGQSVLDVIEEQLPDGVQCPNRPNEPSRLDGEVLERKNKVIAWFKANLLPVNEVDDKIVIDSVTILPPYTPMDILAENTVIVMQTKNILQRMPQDF